MNQMNSQINSPAYYQQQQQQQQQVGQHPPQGAPQPALVNPNMPGAGAGSGIPNPNQIQTTQFSSNLDNDNLTDPLLKSKELLSQLKTSIYFLLDQLSVVLNPQNENRSSNENQFQVLGKYVENFNRVCDLLIVNLRTQYESQHISNELKSFIRFYASIMPEQNRYNEIQSVSNQIMRISELRKSLQDFVSSSTSTSSSSLSAAAAATNNIPMNTDIKPI